MLQIKTRLLIKGLIASCLYFPVIGLALEKDDGVRGARYCEIILSQSKLQFAVFNTMGLNDCPNDLWKQLTAADIKSKTKSFFVYLNGPRHFVIDGFKHTHLVSQKERQFGTLTMRVAGVVRLSLWDLVMGARPYREHRVDRTTTWIYKAHRPVYELIDPKGHVFIMQSYSLEKKPLTPNSLNHLKRWLTLPAGWSYKTGVLQQDMYLKAVNNQAIVVQDNLLNTYQKACHDFL